MTRAEAITLGAASPAARNFAWLAGDKTVATLLGVLVFGLIAHEYGPEGSGHYAYALTLLQVALGLGMVCSTAAILPRVARMRRGVAGAVANVFTVRLLGTLLAMLLVAAYAWFAIDDRQRLIVALLMLASAPLIEPFYVATLFWQSRNANRLPVLNRGVGLALRALLVGLAVAFDAPLWMPAVAWIAEAIIVARLQAGSLSVLGPVRSLMERVTAWRATRYFRYGVRFLLALALLQVFQRTDRLVLAQLLPAHDFGIYATAMQLVDVWLQVGHILSFSIGPAFMYAALQRSPQLRTHWRTLLLMAGIGLAGLVLAAAFGRPVVALVFGPQFGPSYPFLLAGTAFSILAFVDAVPNMSASVSRRPRALAIKWAVSVATALASQLLLFPILHAYAGPAGLALGMVAGWVALWLTPRRGDQRVAPVSLEGEEP